MSPRLSSLLFFFLSWITFGWFHQGGGWNQNARFAEARAIVEQGRFAIDDFLAYRVEGELRVAETVSDAQFMRNGLVHRLCWPAPGGGAPVPVNGRPLQDGEMIAVIGKETATGDIGYAPDGHFYSNKPPGVSLLNAPAYFNAYHLERALGMDPSHWWLINVNVWLF